MKTDTFSFEAEQALIGAMILNNKRIPDVFKIVSRNMFACGSHRKIYDILDKYFVEGIEFNLVSLYSLLKNTNKLEEVGGVGYIVDIVNSVPAMDNVMEYAQVVIDKYIQRKRS